MKYLLRSLVVAVGLAPWIAAAGCVDPAPSTSTDNEALTTSTDSLEEDATAPNAMPEPVNTCAPPNNFSLCQPGCCLNARTHTCYDCV